MDEEKIIEKRKKSLIELLKKRKVWVTAFLIVALILGAYLRSLPMQDHSQEIPTLYRFITFDSFKGNPGLWDITKNDWALGPDLDPWLFTRYAKEIIEKGSLSEIDLMRYVPLGFRTTDELQMVSYMIVITYKITNFFGIYNVIFAAALMPVLLFLLITVAFFLFVREVFIDESESGKTKANIIALISTFFMITIPVFLSRTVAGIPEKESVAFFFMFLSFYLLLKGWRSKKTVVSYALGILAGVATALMGLTWGGVSYVYATIGLSTFVAFLLNKINKKEIIVYSLWIMVSVIVTFVFTTRYSIKGFITGMDTGLVVFVFFLSFLNYFLWNTKAKEKLEKIEFFKKTKIPKNIISLIIGVITIIILISVFLGPEFVLEKINGLNKILINPVTGRWSVTVAENRQPYFKEWANEFGPIIQNFPNFPLMFWLFFLGSSLLFKKLLIRMSKKDSWILTFAYMFFLFGLVFSRYSSQLTFFNGESFASKAFYFGSALLLLGAIVYYYVIYEKKGISGFGDFEYKYVVLFVLFVLCLFTARSAVRLIMVLGPVAPIFASFFIVESVEKFRKARDESLKVFFGFLMLVVLLAGIFSLYSYYQTTKVQSYSFVPSYYNQQWQKAMKWVRENTPKDAVFAHWWDYGYWLQSIGERTTVTDGGNAITFWNYWTGRLVLTGDNQEDALEFLYNHNASYLLIDSSDIGKYGAFSSIGSDKNYDRYSWIGVFLMDETQTQETKNETRFIYTGGIALDENLIINESDKEVFLPGQKTAVGAIILPVMDVKNKTMYNQPYVLMAYSGITHKINLRYLAVGGKFLDFGSGIEAAAYVFPQISVDSQNRIKKNEIGAVMFISPRLLRGFLAQKYILNDPFKKFPNFEVAHKQPNLIIESLNSQGLNLPDFVYFQGVQGPITVWKIKYTGKEKIRPEYNEVDPSKYLSWEL